MVWTKDPAPIELPDNVRASSILFYRAKLDDENPDVVICVTTMPGEPPVKYLVTATTWTAQQKAAAGYLDSPLTATQRTQLGGIGDAFESATLTDRGYTQQP